MTGKSRLSADREAAEHLGRVVHLPLGPGRTIVARRDQSPVGTTALTAQRRRGAKDLGYELLRGAMAVTTCRCSA